MKTYVSVNKKIVSAIKPIMPIAHLNYKGTSPNYATFNIPVRQAAMLQAGTNEKVRVYGYIDVFTVSDPSVANSVLDQIDDALVSAGFSVINIATVAYIDELEKYHSEIEWAIGVDVDG